MISMLDMRSTQENIRFDSTIKTPAQVRDLIRAGVFEILFPTPFRVGNSVNKTVSLSM